jgi:hypothetical protein
MMKQPRTRQSPNEDEVSVKVHATSAGNGIVYNLQPSLWTTAPDGDVNDKEQKKDAK